MKHILKNYLIILQRTMLFDALVPKSSLSDNCQSSYHRRNMVKHTRSDFCRKYDNVQPNRLLSPNVQ